MSQVSACHELPFRFIERSSLVLMAFGDTALAYRR
jgi:hypothetical protein